jgi:hypothetical protein
MPIRPVARRLVTDNRRARGQYATPLKLQPASDRKHNPTAFTRGSLWGGRSAEHLADVASLGQRPEAVRG